MHIDGIPLNRVMNQMKMKSPLMMTTKVSVVPCPFMTFDARQLWICDQTLLHLDHVHRPKDQMPYRGTQLCKMPIDPMKTVAHWSRRNNCRNILTLFCLHGKMSCDSISIFGSLEWRLHWCLRQIAIRHLCRLHGRGVFIFWRGGYRRFCGWTHRQMQCCISCITSRCLGWAGLLRRQLFFHGRRGRWGWCNK